MIRLFAAACLLLAFLQPAAAEKRVALIIANSEYLNTSKLDNPRNDAKAVAKVLTQIGFAPGDVTVKFDLGYDGMRKAIMAFGRAAEGADVAIIYFAGHGYGSGVNYLIPVDAELKYFRDLPSETISQRTLEDAVQPAKRLKLIILDACRNDPSRGRMIDAPRTRGLVRGLEEEEPEAPGVLVIYSAKHGTTAQDGPDGGLSPFATALVHQLSNADDIRFVFGGIRDEVMKATKNEQEPWLYASLGREKIYLVDPAAAAAESPTLAALSNKEYTVSNHATIPDDTSSSNNSTIPSNSAVSSKGSKSTGDKTDVWYKLCIDVPVADTPKQGEPQKQQKSENMKKVNVCLTQADVRDNSTAVLIGKIAVRQVAGQEKPQMLAMLPLGSALPPGALIKVDDKEPIKLQYTTCDQAGCYAEANIEPAVIDQMKAGKQIAYLGIDVTGRALSIPLPLEGFAKAFEERPVSVEKYNEDQRKIADVIRQRLADLKKQQEQKNPQAAGAEAARPAKK